MLFRGESHICVIACKSSITYCAHIGSIRSYVPRSTTGTSRVHRVGTVCVSVARPDHLFRRHGPSETSGDFQDQYTIKRPTTVCPSSNPARRRQTPCGVHVGVLIVSAKLKSIQFELICHFCCISLRDYTCIIAATFEPSHDAAK